MAVSTCLATLIPGTLSASFSYKKHGMYNKSMIKDALLGVILGAIIAPIISAHLPTHILKYYIGFFILLTGIYKLFSIFFKSDNRLYPRKYVTILCIGFLGSLCSGMAGVALGIILIPLMCRYDSYKNVMGTNIMLAFPYAVIASLSYSITGSLHHVAIPFSLGYIYIPAFIGISITMLIFPHIGVWISKRMDEGILKKIFYTYLLISGCLILIG